jgi:hypothetical protein
MTSQLPDGSFPPQSPLTEGGDLFKHALLPPTASVEAAEELPAGDKAYIALEMCREDLALALIGYAAKDAPTVLGKDELLEEALQKEFNFFVKVGTAVFSAASENPHKDMVVYWDIDGTVLAGNTGHSQFMRPAVKFLYDSFESDETTHGRVYAGIISDRPPALLAEEVHHPTFFGAAASRVKGTGYIMSTNRTVLTPEEFELMTSQDDQAKIAQVEELLEPEIVKRTLDPADPLTSRHWFDPKLLRIKERLAERPEEVAVVVDDMSYTGVMRSDLPNVKPVYVCNEQLVPLHPDILAMKAKPIA